MATRLGHADGATTMKIYARRADLHAADIVGKLLSDGHGEPSD